VDLDFGKHGDPDDHHLKQDIRRHVEDSKSDSAILPGFSTTGYASYRIHTEEDPKVHDSPIQGRISEDHAKTPTRA